MFNVTSEEVTSLTMMHFLIILLKWNFRIELNYTAWEKKIQRCVQLQNLIWLHKTLNKLFLTQKHMIKVKGQVKLYATSD